MFFYTGYVNSSKNIYFFAKKLDRITKILYNLYHMIHFWGRLQMKEFITNLFPFKDVKNESMNKILAAYSFKTEKFERGETVFSHKDEKGKIGFVINGECEVYKPRKNGENVFLNSLMPLSSFGILSVINPNSEFPTIIKAKKKTTVLFISGQDFLKIIQRYPKVSLNVIKFLADRINFLNKKISSFSEKTVEEKVALYLIEKSKECNEIDFCGTKISAVLNCGRASLYRALETFVQLNLIKIENKKIYIISPSGLERILK